METSNRRMIRPPLAEVKERPSANSGSARNAAAAKKQIPPETTNAENYYYIKQMQSKTPMVIVMRDGEELHGVIEWYDKNCLKFNREDGPNLLVFKSFVKYMYKAG